MFIDKIKLYVYFNPRIINLFFYLISLLYSSYTLNFYKYYLNNNNKIYVYVNYLYLINAGLVMLKK